VTWKTSKQSFNKSSSILVGLVCFFLSCPFSYTTSLYYLADLFTTSSLEDNALELTDELIHISRREYCKLQTSQYLINLLSFIFLFLISAQKDKKISIMSMDTKPFNTFFAKCMKTSVCWPSLFYSRMVRKKELLPHSDFKRCSGIYKLFSQKIFLEL